MRKVEMTHRQRTNLKYDVLVAGGGPAGLSCALAAARNGVRVVLCQDRPVLGGNASSEVRMHIVGANGLREGIPMVAEAREGGLVEEFRLRMAVENAQRSASVSDLVLYDLCRSEPNLDLMLNTVVVGVDVEGTVIRAAFAERPSTEDCFRIEADWFIDATGDGRLGVESGAEYRHGREGREAYGESLAPVQADRMTLGSTLLYQARKHDRPMPFRAPSWARRFTAEKLRYRPFGQKGSDLNLEFGFWWVEWGGQLDTVQDNEAIRDELLAVILGVWDFIKNESDVDADNWALEWVGFVPGKRESRRFLGRHLLCQQDLQEAPVVADAIATGGWPIDTHPPQGVDAPDEPPCIQTELPWLYSIPLRSCLSKDLDNLGFAGRNLSATHIAFASTRVMATCSAVGQGLGTAVARMVREGLNADQLLETDRMKGLQQQLLRQDAMLLDVRNEDIADLAREAQVSASSEMAEGPAAAVIDGYSRSLHGSGKDGASGGPICAPPDRYPAGTHRWMSRAEDGFPVSLRLSWSGPVSLNCVELTFDTGLHRFLTLSQADGYTKKMIWGPQPETVRDYRIRTKRGKTWRDVLKVEGNFQRKCCHRFERQEEVTEIEVIVLATNGLDHARIFEVRVYDE